MKESLSRIFDKYKFDKNIAEKSKTWFQQQVILLAQKRINKISLFKQEKQYGNIAPGNLYLFYYEALHKDTLPYYDRFPLVFPYRKIPGGFIGLNMHYLPYYWRVKLLDRLMQFSTNDKLDYTTKIRYSWSLISGMSKFKIAEPCIKQYLSDQVKSAFIKVKPEDWHTAMMLPVESFVGANKNQVWEDNKRWLR